MKKTLTLLALLLGAVLALTACGESLAVPDGMQRASTEINDFYFFVPANWTLNTQTGFVSAYVGAADPTSVSVTSYGIDGEPKTVDEYVADALAELGAYAEIGAVAVSDTFLDNAEAKQIEYTATIAGTNYRVQQIFCVKRDTVYLFTYTATPEKFEEHLPKVGIILAEFRFMDAE